MDKFYMTTHNNWDANMLLPFVVSTFNKDEVYLEPIWGIKIKRIIQDNSVISPFVYDIDLDDLNFNKMKTNGKPFIYQVRFHDLYLAKSFNEENYALEKYNLSPNAELIIIEYQLRESSESFGPLIILESHLV